jgi:hypothetical protein
MSEEKARPAHPLAPYPVVRARPAFCTIPGKCECARPLVSHPRLSLRINLCSDFASNFGTLYNPLTERKKNEPASRSSALAPTVSERKTPYHQNGAPNPIKRDEPPDAPLAPISHALCLSHHTRKRMHALPYASTPGSVMPFVLKWSCINTIRSLHRPGDGVETILVDAHALPIRRAFHRRAQAPGQSQQDPRRLLPLRHRPPPL